MSSDIESSHQITVPVFIEPAPPEIRLGDEEEGGQSASSYWREDGVNRLVHQETMHTDSGLDTEDICPATPTGGRFSVLSPGSPGASKRPGDAANVAAHDENYRICHIRPPCHRNFDSDAFFRGTYLNYSFF